MTNILGKYNTIFRARSEDLTLLPRNDDNVKASGYDTIATGVGNLGATSYMDLLNISHQNRVRQNGDINQVQFYVHSDAPTLAAGGKIIFKVWRLDGATYDLVGSEDITAKLTAQTTNLVTLTTPMPTQEGDYVGFGLDSTVASIGSPFKSSSGIGDLRYTLDKEMPSVNADWDSEAQLTDGLPTYVYMQAPHVVTIGDSLMSGYTLNRSFIEVADTTDIPNQVSYQLSQLLPIVYQNMGIGAERMFQISDRFAADVVALKPRYALINGGVNDLAASVAKSQYIEKWTEILILCQNNNIIPWAYKIWPWQTSNAISQEMDDWNADLEALVKSYGGKIIDCTEALGQFRAGGDAGNLWDLKASLDSGDHVHLNLAGYTAAASVTASSVL